MMMQRFLQRLTSRKWMVMALFFTHCSLFISPLGAQTFTQRLQQSAKGEGKVTLHQQKGIDELVNGAAQAAPAEKKPAETKEKQPAATAEKKTAEAAMEKAGGTLAAKGENAAGRMAQRDTAEVTADSAAQKKLGHTYKVTGYRVQAFAGGNSRADRQKAEQTGNQLRMLFPDEAVYTHFYSPRWICRMGNYRTYAEALQMLREVKKLGFASATIVKGKITVQY